ncbi:radical SAM/SPASM domain-containing protein [Butyrivibrio sp. VCB2006]|uniref:radical SAM/SPASM domain-containing protein n=1 Tax=Butyrivibrio sp. VCB2006 TaxID=1280679 RepID=UPI000411FC2A|nr:radical SAM protein [Butyrivibrio sp. VCB2006]
MVKKYRNYDITLVVTHRCNARCIMCNSYKQSSCKQDEISLADIMKLPCSKFIQITGGEPFVREDIEEIVKILLPKTKRLMINTNGYYTDKIVDLCKKYPDLVIRVSIDGNRETHNRIRQIDIYDRAIDTLKQLKALGIPDLGISFTLQESNYDQMIDMYKYALELGVDFGVSVIHNSYYFNKSDNVINDTTPLKAELKKLVNIQLMSNRKKDWARAYFNDMSINYIDRMAMPVKCDAGRSSFTIECNGNVLPCNMTPTEWVMGNLKRNTWDEIIKSDSSNEIMEKCRNCKLNCWSVCNVQSALKKKIWVPGVWFMTHFFAARFRANK